MDYLGNAEDMNMSGTYVKSILSLEIRVCCKEWIISGREDIIGLPVSHLSTVMHIIVVTSMDFKHYQGSVRGGGPGIPKSQFQMGSNPKSQFQMESNPKSQFQIGSNPKYTIMSRM